MPNKLFTLLFASLVFFSCTQKTEKLDEYVDLQNPIIPGYFADPSIVQHEGKFYLYVTADPWGADFLSCWVSSDFQNWTFNTLNWPTKEACTSPLSNSNKVWAPSVIKKGDKFYMYISVGSEVWCGVADHPLGPWKNALGDKQMLEYDKTEYCHVIDAEVFIDDDQRAYLYWGSGWNWTNGRCYVAELNDDMCTFKTEKKEITPSRYFEGPLVTKHNSKYYLSYSEGITMNDTYEVRYAISDSPMGEFVEAPNSPILKTNDSLNVYGPGHHTIFTYDDKNYILYHRHRLPFVTETAFRQLCINEIKFDDEKGLIENIIPYNTQSFPNIKSDKKAELKWLAIKASSKYSDYTSVEKLSDKSYATRWEAADDDKNANLMIDFEPNTFVDYLSIRFEYPWKVYYPKIEVSDDGANWKFIADHWVDGVSGSPVDISVKAKAAFVKISFNPEKEIKTSIWELDIY